MTEHEAAWMAVGFVALVALVVLWMEPEED